MSYSCILFYEPLTPKTYLDHALSIYPYDIAPTLAYTLLTHCPYPHPALVHFIDFIRKAQKYFVTSSTMQVPNLDEFFMKLCRLSQHNHTLLHIHQFHMDALFHMTQIPIFHPYAYLSLEHIALIDQIQLLQYTPLPLQNEPASCHITVQDQFPLQDISFDETKFFALSIHINHCNAILFLPRDHGALIIALSSLYQMTTPHTHPDFFLFYGCHQPSRKHVVYHDLTNHLYIGCCSHTFPYASLQECRNMIQSLYGILMLQKQDVSLQASMIMLHIHHRSFGILICGEEHSGKSECLNTLISYCGCHHLPITKVFEQFGTLHVLDDTISATGNQIGAAFHVQSLSNEQIYEYLSSSILVKEEQTISYCLTPFTTYEETCQFHPVSMILFLDQHKQDKQMTRLSSIEDAIQMFSAITALHDATQLEHMQPLWEHVVNTIFLNEIPILHLSKKSIKRKSQQWIDQVMEQMLHTLVDDQDMDKRPAN